MLLKTVAQNSKNQIEGYAIMNPNNDSSLLIKSDISPNHSDEAQDQQSSLELSNLLNRPSSRHYFYRKASLPNSIAPVNEDASTLEFENRLKTFVQSSSIQNTTVAIQEASHVELTRRKAERRARKEKEKRATNRPTEELLYTGPIFSKLNELLPIEKNAWLANIHDEAMLLNPHQWLKLGSLFNVNSKAARQISVLPCLESLPEVLEDRSIKFEEVRRLENYLELRDVQNRNYARDSVAEGAKLIKVNKLKEAMEHYKRALDMDPKYADGWLYVAEAFVQQKKLKEAGEQLEKVLKLEPEHEGAKALLASVRHALDPKPQKKDEWDLVDEDGHDMSSKKKNRDPSPRKKRNRSRSPYHRRKRTRSRSPSNRHSKRRVSPTLSDQRKRKGSQSPSDRRSRRSSRSKNRQTQQSSRSPSGIDRRKSSRERWHRSKDTQKDYSRERKRDTSRENRKELSKERSLDRKRRETLDDAKEDRKRERKYERSKDSTYDSRGSRGRKHERNYKDASVDSKEDGHRSYERRRSQEQKHDNRLSYRKTSGRSSKRKRNDIPNVDTTQKRNKKESELREDLWNEIPKTEIAKNEDRHPSKENSWSDDKTKHKARLETEQSLRKDTQ